MEDVLAVYTRPRDGDCPLVCLDETSKQLIAETRVPISMKAGRPARFDYEYERNGTANLFMIFAPLEGWRHVKVTDRHTAVDYARVLKDLADIHFAHAKTIVLVQDNLSIHSKASLYEVFPAVEARRLVERFEWHYTPKHGSWLNLAESELGVLTSQCLDRRIPNKQILIDEIAAWEHDRDANHTKEASQSFWLTKTRKTTAPINVATKVPTTSETTQFRLSIGFDPAAFCAAPMPNQKRSLSIAVSAVIGADLWRYAYAYGELAHSASAKSLNPGQGYPARRRRER